MMVQRFSEIFQSLSLYNHTMMAIKLMPNARPDFHSKWLVPLSGLPIVDEGSKCWNKGVF
ncbi:unnamed protein product [Hymenolepis diminuta]|uniref:Uncharacterized protein n=1 Tax=Hymenolepis diminuta TaxID=6216 RepID=A0A564YA91_HYMDI|nr:unnamed protein product [Hymenolepis diminuta]